MGENTGSKIQAHAFDLSAAAAPPQGPSKCFDDDGRLKRTGKFLCKNCSFFYRLFIRVDVAPI